MLPTVWKDVGFLSFGLLACGLVWLEGRRLRWTRLSLAFACVFYASTVRWFAWFALLPVIWLLAREIGEALVDRFGNTAWTARMGSWGSFAAVVLLLLAGMSIVNSVGVEDRPYRAAVPIWDLSRLSLDTNELLIPDYAIHVERIDLERLDEISDADSARIHDEKTRNETPPDLDYALLSNQEANRLILDWARVVVHHPSAYLRHRARVTSRLFTRPVRKSVHHIQPIFGFWPRYRHEFPKPYHRLKRSIRRLERRSFLYQPWIYVVLGAGAAGASFWVRGRRGWIARQLACVGLLSVALLPIIAPSLDFRYSIGCVAASVLSSGIVVAALLGGDGRLRPG